MAVHDLACNYCEAVFRDVNIPVYMGARAYCAGHWCPSCQCYALEPIPAIGRMSIFGECAKTSVQLEDTAAPGGYREVPVHTLGDIRRLERESEQLEREGRGRRMIWRDYAQDRSNTDVHTMGPDPSMRPAKTYTNGTPVVLRRGDPVVADHGELEE